MYYLKISLKATEKNIEITFVFFEALWETGILVFLSTDHFAAVFPVVV